LLVLTAGCGFKPVGRPYNEALAAKLPVGTATTGDVKTAIGAPFRARPLVKSDAPTDCPSASESWDYSYFDLKENICNSTLFFDESAHLCSRKTEAKKRGPACSGVTP
jgi:hypothetical protein